MFIPLVTLFTFIWADNSLFTYTAIKSASPNFGINSIVFNPTNFNDLYVASEDGVLRRLDVTSGLITKQYSVDSVQLSAVIIKTNLNLVIASSYDGKSIAWDMSTGAIYRTYAHNTSSINGVFADSTGLYSYASSDIYIQRFDIRSGINTVFYAGGSQLGNGFAFQDLPSSVIYMGGNDGTIRSFDVNGTLLGLLYQVNYYVAAMVKQGNYLYFGGGGDYATRKLDLSTNLVVNAYSGHTFDVRFLIISGDMLLSASDDNYIRQFVVATGNCIHVYDGHTSNIESLQISSSGYLYSGNI